LRGEAVYEAAQNFAKKHGLILLVKGAHTAIYAPNGDVYFNSSGCNGMATAGSGDVLTGIITGLLAQGLSPLHAAIAGVFYHGKAGEAAAKLHGNAGMVASDIITNLSIAE
jgi:NAD(P)H-hydrate epimerase